MKYIKQTYKFLIVVLLLSSCKSTKFVPNDRYLLKKNILKIKDKTIKYEDIALIIRQQPNKKMFGIKWDLFFYNRIDSIKVADKRARKNIEIRFENESRIAEVKRINLARIEKAKKKGQNTYKKKEVELLDTLEPTLFFKEWLKYRVGEAPVIFDSISFNKTIEQLNAYIKKKGYYYGDIHGVVKYKRNRKVKVKYFINPGKQYFIDSVYEEVNNEVVKRCYEKFKTRSSSSLIGQPFDIDHLDEYRTNLARFMRDNALYGYSPNSIKFSIDTNKAKMSVTLGIKFMDRKVFSDVVKDSIIHKKYQETVVENVYFHIVDTTLFSGNFKDTLISKGILNNGKYLPTIDTLLYNKILDRHTKQLDPSREAYFLFNGELFLNPQVIEVQNLLQKNNNVTESFIEATYTRLQQLGLFQTIKTEILEVPESNKVQVHYFLIPAKKEAFSTQFRVTTTNGYFGLSTGLNYTNKNLFRGAEKLTFGINGSLQAVPPLNDQKIDNTNLKDVATKFYQFEIGPSLKLELPGLFLLKKTKTNKSRLAKTIFSTAYAYQKRDAYVKENIQLNSIWKYEIRNTQTIQMGIPGISVIKFVSIQKADFFEEFLKKKNNPFQTNTFSNQFIWQDWKVSFEYRDKDKASKTRRSNFYYLGTFDLAGNLISAFKKFQVKDTLGQYRVGGLVYSQFSRIDNTIIYTLPFGKTKSLNIRSLIGTGLTYGNSKTSMPYDYSFYAGGSNDVRGWKASSLGPGSYKYYIDTNGTSIQIGDIRIAGSAEFRYQYNKKWKGALFIDAGNIWTMKTDYNRLGSKFSKNWFKEIAIAPGIGLRRDFDYFIIRVDLGFPIHNPGLPLGERWIFQNHTQYYKELDDFITNNPNMSTDARNKIVTTPFLPRFSFGIGYPF